MRKLLKQRACKREPWESEGKFLDAHQKPFTKKRLEEEMGVSGHPEQKASFTAAYMEDGHTWYLTEELFISVQQQCEQGNEKENGVEIMISRQVCSKRFGSRYGAPKCPKIPLNGSLDLTMFVQDD